MLTGDELDFSNSLLDAILTDRRGHIVITLSDEILELLTTPVFLEAVVKLVINIMKSLPMVFEKRVDRLSAIQNL